MSLDGISQSSSVYMYFNLGGPKRKKAAGQGHKHLLRNVLFGWQVWNMRLDQWLRFSQMSLPNQPLSCQELFKLGKAMPPDIHSSFVSASLESNHFPQQRTFQNAQEILVLHLSKKFIPILNSMFPVEHFCPSGCVVKFFQFKFFHFWLVNSWASRLKSLPLGSNS